MEKLNPIDRSETVINNNILENIWHFRDGHTFEKEMKEFYKPDIWFTDKQGSFETHVAESVKNARDSIVLCSFLLEKTEITDALLDIINNNVRVYILTASENQIEKIYNLESELEDERIVEHKNLLKILRKKCLIRSAPHFHAKYILVDPKSDSRLGFLTSANFTHHAFTNNIEIGMQLNSNQIIDLFNLFCHVFWNESKHEYLVEDTLSSVKKPPKDYIQSPQLSHIISPRMNIDFENTIKECIEKTTGNIYISTYSIDDKNSIHGLLMEQLKKKRKVVIFIRPRKNDLEALNKLYLLGAKIYGHPLLHFKCLLIDNDKEKRGLIFTGNLTEESFNQSHDVGIFLNSEQYRKLLDLIKRWNNSITGVYMGRESLEKLPKGSYLMWNPKKYEFQIQSSEIKNLGVLEGESIDKYNNFRPNLEIPEELKFTTKEITFKWINTPPKLPSKSKQVNKLPEGFLEGLKDSAQRFNIFQKGKEYYIVYREGDDLKKLKKVSELTHFKIVVE